MADVAHTSSANDEHRTNETRGVSGVQGRQPPLFTQYRSTPEPGARKGGRNPVRARIPGRAGHYLFVPTHHALFLLHDFIPTTSCIFTLVFGGFRPAPRREARIISITASIDIVAMWRQPDFPTSRTIHDIGSLLLAFSSLVLVDFVLIWCGV